MIHRTSPHEVAADALPDDSRRVCPLTGNSEIKTILDSRGCMHDYEPSQPSWAPPRIVWTGRRHTQTMDRYNSNLFEWGFLNVRLRGEETLGPVTSWRQRLDPHEGYIETVVCWGKVEEHTISFIHLEKNLLVVHRRYVNLDASRDWSIEGRYTFCHVGVDDIPFRTTWSPLPAWDRGIAADTTADGMTIYRGRIALYASQPCAARSVANRLELDVPLNADGSATVVLSLADDLGNDAQLLEIPENSWMPHAVLEVNREVEAARASRVKPDPVATTDAWRRAFEAQGFAGLFESQKRAWRAFRSQCKLELPSEPAELRGAFDTALYHVRCGFSAYSWGSSPFNTSWGAHYAWNERYPIEGLLGLGIVDMPKSVAEWRRRTLPFCSRMAGGRGARYLHSCVEPGRITSDRNCTNHYQFHIQGLMAHWMESIYRYTGDEADLRRYYPVIRECAEFYRHWLLVELPGNHLMTVPLVDVHEALYPQQDGPFTVCSAAKLFNLAWRAAEQLGVDPDMVPTWKRYGAMAIRLARHVAERGVIYNDLELGDIPDPDLEQDPAIQAWRDEYKEANKPTNQFKKYGQNVSGDRSKPPIWPWGLLQQVYDAGTVSDPDRAAVNLEKMFTVLLDFSALSESTDEKRSRIDHPWFTTAAGALLRGIARICLYPKDDLVYVMSGIPRAWKTLSFELPAHRKLAVRAALSNGVLTQLDLTPQVPQRRQMQVRVPERLCGPDTRWTTQQVSTRDGWVCIDATVEREVALIKR